MLVLALDTTTRSGSCALVSDGRVLREEVSEDTRPQAERLPADLIGLLERTHVTLADVDVFAVATGPGSFTGLRIGIAAMQGLAFATAKPLVGISGLDALAALAPTQGTRVATWVDAWRGEVYAALYEGTREIEAPTVAPPHALLDRVGSGSIVFIGDGADTFRQMIAERLGLSGRIADPVRPALAGAVARLAQAVATAGHCPDPREIRPLYVRRPDVILARDARTTR
jgi:tRNA threonylcarbamoyladenosine biosynthesis protein TsaB